LNWECQPSSQFLVVYGDGRDTLGGGMADLLSRSLAIKITGLLRFLASRCRDLPEIALTPRRCSPR